MTKILVCDDERVAFEQTRSTLPPGHDVRELVGSDLRRAFRTLFKEVRRSLSDEVNSDFALGAAFEDADVAIVDNNLSQLELDGVRLTAEAMIGYLRAFTNIPYIISLNKNPDVDFDLRYMVGDYQTHADLALNTEHLSCAALWRNGLNSGDVGDVFAPSYWPNIHELAPRRRELISAIEGRLGDPVIDVLNLPQGALQVLSRHARGILGPHANTDQDIREVTCIDFFNASCRSLLKKDRDILAASIASAPNPHAKSVARTVAADLDKWVRRDALGPQDVLIDLPHLLARMPFLLGKDAEEVPKWNSALYPRTSRSEDALRFISNTTVRERVERAQFDPLGIYLRWPCFLWHSLRDDDKLNGLFFSCEDQWADVVFCEDISQFVDISNEGLNDGPKEFEAEFGGAWSRRYVKDLSGFQYSPRSRFAI